jgi:ABC-type branched-subunit amino acid transport system ATPase component
MTNVEITLKNYRCFDDTTPATFHLNHCITGLVGPNNCGKSTLLRAFYELRPLLSQLTRPTGNQLEALKGQPQAFPGFGNMVADQTEVFANTNDRDLVVTIAPLLHPTSTRRYRETPNAVTRVDITVPRDTTGYILRARVGELWISGQDLSFTGNTVTEKGDPLLDLTEFYSVCRDLESTMYIDAFRNAINAGASSYYDIQVGQSLISQWRSLQTGHSKRANEAVWQLTNEIRHIFEFQSLVINAAEDGTTLQLFIDGRSYRLGELGAGLAEFIIVLLNAAVRRPAFILVDEPEIHLHPTLQLDFMTTLASYARVGVLFASHNLGLARASADLLYSVQRLKGTSRIAPIEQTARLPEFLGELGYSGYRELGYDQVLLVEGSSELKVIQQFLRLYGKDHHVVLVSLGGSGLIRHGSDAELAELKRLAPKVSAVIDSERSAADAPLDAARQAFIETCSTIGIPCVALQHRALENYFTDNAIKQVKGAKYRALQPYERLRDVDPSWGKAESWKIARAMRKSDLDQTDLGATLDAL